LHCKPGGAVQRKKALVGGRIAGWRNLAEINTDDLEPPGIRGETMKLIHRSFFVVFSTGQEIGASTDRPNRFFVMFESPVSGGQQRLSDESGQQSPAHLAVQQPGLKTRFSSLRRCLFSQVTGIATAEAGRSVTRHGEATHDALA
jgi:hypothetical protein